MILPRPLDRQSTADRSSGHGQGFRRPDGGIRQAFFPGDNSPYDQPPPSTYNAFGR